MAVHEQSQQVALVTGSTRGIGLHSAGVLAANGYAVAVCSRSSDAAEDVAEALSARHGVACYGGRLDVGDWAAGREFVSDVERELGRVSVLVNNAAVLGPVGSIDEVDLDEWAAAVNIDLLGVAVMTAAVVPGMRALGGGRVVNLAGGGVGGPGVARRLSAYTSSKAGVITFTETVAAELVASGIQVNAIAPGAVATGFMDPLIEAGPEKAGQDLYERTIAQRATPEDLSRYSELLLHLSKPGAGGLTGRTLSARWDSIERLETIAATLEDSALFQMRRIDNALYSEKRMR